MRGRWHGRAVTDEVETPHLRDCAHLISRLAATASPHRGSHWSAQFPSLPWKGRWLGEAETERSYQICGNLSVTFGDSSPGRGAFPREKVTSIRISSAPSIDGSRSKATSIKLNTPRIRRRVAETRKVSIEWNARPKHWGLPKFRGRMHPASPRTLFFPIFSLAREKIGPPEARQKRPRRNEPPQATSLILCARFFLSKPQTEFAVWVFPCRSAATSQSA